MLQHATHTAVVLETGWPWASEACRLCRLCACFCAHKLTRARSLLGTYGVLTAIKGCRCWCWCCGPGCWWAFKTGGAGRALPVLSACTGSGVSWLFALWKRVSWLCRLRAFLFQPVACQRRWLLSGCLGLCWCNLFLELGPGLTFGLCPQSFALKLGSVASAAASEPNASPEPASATGSNHHHCQSLHSFLRSRLNQNHSRRRRHGSALVF